MQVLWDDKPDLSFKRDVLLFLNTVVNSSLEVEERIETRCVDLEERIVNHL